MSYRLVFYERFGLLKYEMRLRNQGPSPGPAGPNRSTSEHSKDPLAPRKTVWKKVPEKLAVGRRRAVRRPLHNQQSLNTPAVAEGEPSPIPSQTATEAVDDVPESPSDGAEQVARGKQRKARKQQAAPVHRMSLRKRALPVQAEAALNKRSRKQGDPRNSGAVPAHAATAEPEGTNHSIAPEAHDAHDTANDANITGATPVTRDSSGPEPTGTAKEGEEALAGTSAASDQRAADSNGGPEQPCTDNAAEPRHAVTGTAVDHAGITGSAAEAAATSNADAAAASDGCNGPAGLANATARPEPTRTGSTAAAGLAGTPADAALAGSGQNGAASPAGGNANGATAAAAETSGPAVHVASSAARASPSGGQPAASHVATAPVATQSHSMPAPEVAVMESDSEVEVVGEHAVSAASLACPAWLQLQPRPGSRFTPPFSVSTEPPESRSEGSNAAPSFSEAGDLKTVKKALSQRIKKLGTQQPDEAAARSRVSHDTRSHCSCTVSSADLSMLGGTNWLPSGVINACLDALQRRLPPEHTPAVHCFSTFFFSKLVEGSDTAAAMAAGAASVSGRTRGVNRRARRNGTSGADSSQGPAKGLPRVNYENVQRWTVRAQPLVGADVMVAPINECDRHWLLMLASVSRREIVLLDSLFSEARLAEYRRLLEAMWVWLLCEVHNKHCGGGATAAAAPGAEAARQWGCCGGDRGWQRGWKLKVAGGVPQQGDGGSCGALVLAYADCAMRGWWPGQPLAQTTGREPALRLGILRLLRG
eukprot:jgi/Ulvmu1/10261/UM060_0062.1